MVEAAQIIEIRSGTGSGDPSSMPLTVGTVLKPTSVGRSGMWRVDGQGVLDVHGYVYFDGKALFVQSADEKSPMMVNNHRVGTAWTQVHAPSTITLGQAELIYRATAKEYEDGDMTLAQPLGAVTQGRAPDSERTRAISHPMMAFKPNAGEFANRADDESTRFAPLAMGAPTQQEAPRQAEVRRPAAGGMMAGFPPPQMESAAAPQPMMHQQLPPGMQGMPQQGMQGQPVNTMQLPPGMQGMPGQGMPGQMHPGMQPMGSGAWPQGTGPHAQVDAPKPAGGMDLEAIKAQWNALPGAKKALLAMGPFVLIAVFFMFSSDDSTPAVKGVTGQTSATSMTVTPPTSQTGGMMPGAGMGQPSNGFPGLGAQPGAGPGPTGVSPIVTQPPPPPVAPPPPSGKASPGGSASAPAPGAMPSKKSQERLAADAWTEGNFEIAARIYDQLAAQSPGNPAYREAARICREKQAGAR